jgi:hypothetical protein
LAELGFPANPANAPKIARIGPANTGVGLICQGFPADAVRRSRVRSSDALDSQNAGYCYQGKSLYCTSAGGSSARTLSSDPEFHLFYLLHLGLVSEQLSTTPVWYIHAVFTAKTNITTCDQTQYTTPEGVGIWAQAQYNLQWEFASQQLIERLKLW